MLFTRVLHILLLEFFLFYLINSCDCNDGLRSKTKTTRNALEQPDVGLASVVVKEKRPMPKVFFIYLFLLINYVIRLMLLPILLEFSPNLSNAFITNWALVSPVYTSNVALNSSRIS